MIDVILLAIIALVTWTVAAEGAWGSATVFLSILISGLVAMDFFEPLAGLLESVFGPDWSTRFDFIALVGLFALCVFGLRTLSERIVPSFIAVHSWVYDACRWGFAALSGYVTAAIVLTALHTAPLPRDFLGFRPERSNLLGIFAPDRQWLGFVQYASEKSLRSSEEGRVFDGARFRVPNHENDVWPTFIIRYASRREGGAVVAGSSTPAGMPGGSGGTARPVAPAAPGGL